MTLCPPGSSVLGDSPGKNIGMGCHALLQGIFSTPGLNPGLPHCRQILYCLGTREASTGALSAGNRVERESVSPVVLADSLQPHGLELSRLLCPWGFSRQEYWSGLPCPPLGDLLDPGIEPMSLMSPALAGKFFTTGTTWSCEMPGWMNHKIVITLID